MVWKIIGTPEHLMGFGVSIDHPLQINGEIVLTSRINDCLMLFSTV